MRFLCIMAGLALTLGVRAESELEPSLGIAFPLELKDGSVVCGDDVILNRETVLTKGTILMTAFIPPKPDDKDVKRKNARVDLEKTFSRKKPDVTNSEENALERAMLSVAQDRALRILWDDPDFFRGWFHKQRAEDYYLVFRSPEEGSEPRFARLEFIEGMFLLGRETGITVAGVVPGSRAQEAGVKAGDVIRSISGAAYEGPVNEFAKTLLLSIRAQEKAGQPLVLGLVESASGMPREVSLAVPYSLRGNPFE